MELVKLHVLERDSSPVCNRNAVTGQGVRIRGGFVDLSETTGCKDNRLCGEYVNVSRCQIVGNDTGWLALVHDQVQNIELVEEVDSKLHAVLVQSLQDHVASAVCCVATASNRCFSVVSGVATETTLVNLALRGPVKRQSHVLEVDHCLN